MDFKLPFRKIALTLLLTVCGAAHAWAANITYKIQSYGNKHAVINLSGPGSGTLSVTPTNDGQQVRISGVEVGYVSDGNQNFSGIVTDAQQVRRGAYTDLVLSFRGKTSISATPGAGNLKLFVRLIAPIATPDPQPSASIASSTTPKPPTMPIRLLSTLPIQSDKDAKPAGGLTIVFPGAEQIRSPFSASKELRGAAYVLDLLWAWVFNSGASDYDTTAPVTPSKDLRSGELDSLVQDLTKELVEVRKELMAKEEEIRSLRRSGTGQ